jgi:uncharacterized protein YecT (DUF1311 family)
MLDLLTSILKVTTPVQLVGIGLIVLWRLALLLVQRRSHSLPADDRRALAARIVNWIGVICLGGLAIWALIIIVPHLFRDPPTALATDIAPRATPAPVDWEALKGATYVLDGRRVSLTDGRLDFEPSPEEPNPALYPLHVTLEKAAFGDLTGDGAMSAVALLESSDGGTGIYSHVVPVIRQRGRLTSDAEPITLGDRLQFTRLEILNEHVYLDVLMHRDTDASGRASIVRHLEFSYANGTLVCLTQPCSDLNDAAGRPLVRLPATPAEGGGPSYDCKRAREEDERAICTDATLSRLEALMAKRYRAAVGASSGEDRASLILAQRAWLIERTHRCGASVGCLRDYLHQRADQLGDGM